MFKKLIAKYFRPTSSAWWSGVAMTVYGAVNQDWPKVIEGAGIIGIRCSIGGK